MDFFLPFTFIKLSSDSVVEIWKDSGLGEFESWDKYAIPIVRKGKICDLQKGRN